VLANQGGNLGGGTGKKGKDMKFPYQKLGWEGRVVLQKSPMPKKKKKKKLEKFGVGRKRKSRKQEETRASFQEQKGVGSIRGEK